MRKTTVLPPRRTPVASARTLGRPSNTKATTPRARRRPARFASRRAPRFRGSVRRRLFAPTQPAQALDHELAQFFVGDEPGGGPPAGLGGGDILGVDHAGCVPRSLHRPGDRRSAGRNPRWLRPRPRPGCRRRPGRSRPRPGRCAAPRRESAGFSSLGSTTTHRIPGPESAGPVLRERAGCGCRRRESGFPGFELGEFAALRGGLRHGSSLRGRRLPRSVSKRTRRPGDQGAARSSSGGVAALASMSLTQLPQFFRRRRWGARPPLAPPNPDDHVFLQERIGAGGGGAARRQPNRRFPGGVRPGAANTSPRCGPPPRRAGNRPSASSFGGARISVDEAQRAGSEAARS